jgi:hypothetical protein
MYIARRSPREIIQLPAFLEVRDRPGEILKVPATTLDLGSGGVGLRIARPRDLRALDPGLPLAVVIQDLDVHRTRFRRWRGQVVYDRSTDDGPRLGIRFQSPELGPAITIHLPQKGDRGRGERRLRFDGGPSPPPGDAPTPPDRLAEALADHGVKLFRGVTLGGMALDQLAKGWFAGGGVEPAALAPLRFSGNPLLDCLPTLIGLSTGGLIAQFAEEKDMAARPGRGLGLGLVLGGLMSCLLDRTAFGVVREIPGWSGSPAQVLSLAGAALVLASLLFGEGPGPNLGGRDRRRSPSPG